MKTSLSEFAAVFVLSQHFEIGTLPSRHPFASWVVLSWLESCNLPPCCKLFEAFLDRMDFFGEVAAIERELME